jgi:hypothetical protein
VESELKLNEKNFKVKEFESERKQQERSQRTPQPSTGATGLVYHTLSIGGIKREYYLYTPANIRSNLTDKR